MLNRGHATVNSSHSTSKVYHMTIGLIPFFDYLQKKNTNIMTTKLKHTSDTK